MPRETICTIDHWELDDYGNLKFWDKHGDEYKLSKKREHLFPQIQQTDKAVKLLWSVYKGIEYISDVVAVEDEIAYVESELKRPQTKPDNKNRGYAMSYSKDISVAKIMMGKDTGWNDLEQLADKILEWLDK